MADRQQTRVHVWILGHQLLAASSSWWWSSRKRGVWGSPRRCAGSPCRFRV